MNVRLAIFGLGLWLCACGPDEADKPVVSAPAVDREVVLEEAREALSAAEITELS